MFINEFFGKKKVETVAEGEDNCPPATQDIALNLENRKKAIDEYGYGPLNPALPNTKFWMRKVNEWNLDSADEAKQSLCGNCAAFDVRQNTLDCIAQGIDSSNPEDAAGVIDAGELGYCKFLKFKCASQRTCDAWVTGGPLTDEQGVAEGAVEDLAKDLKNPHSYNAIDHMMQSIANKSNVTPKELHNQFVEKYGMTPDEWIKNEQGVEETYGAKLHTEHKRNRFKQLEKIKQQQEKALGLGEAGCNMTNEGRYCSEHGMMECPGYGMTETSVQDKLHQQHQELRKQRGLPDPSYYKKLAAQKQAEIDALRAEIAADQAKSMKESLRPGEYHHYEDDPKTGKRVYKGIRGDQYDAPKKTTGHEPDADRDRAAHRAHDRSMTESIESYMEELERAGYGLQEEKVRLDPKCWTGKKIGSPKTKVKGGVRVNNCVPK